jgi:hypothetical protein
MANIVPDSFKTDLLGGVFDFDSSGGSTFKLALYTDISGFSTSTTAYTTSNEVSSSGTSYTAGGNTLTNNGVAVSSNIAYVDFADLTFSSVTLTAATNGDFVVQFPTADSSNAIIRLGDA